VAALVEQIARTDEPVRIDGDDAVLDRDSW
jgi:hypothetical protein